MRARSTMQAGRHKDYTDEAAGLGMRQCWEGGIYENTYKKGADGMWRIHVLNYFPHWHADFDKGWAFTDPEYTPHVPQDALPRRALRPRRADRGPLAVAGAQAAAVPHEAPDHRRGNGRRALGRRRQKRDAEREARKKAEAAAAVTGGGALNPSPPWGRGLRSLAPAPAGA